MLKRFIIYGLIGWIVEVIFTGTFSLLSGSVRLTAHTYLWMFPIYGLAVFFEPIHDEIRSLAWPVRGLIWAILIFSIEYTTGWLLKSAIGICPWDYSGNSVYSVQGFIRLDFAPFWFTGGLIWEKIHDYLDSLEEKIR